MTDQELLTVAESVLRDAIAEVEFTRTAKDLQYAQHVANKVEELRAKISGGSLITVSYGFIGGRLFVESEMRGFSFRRKS